MMDLDLHEEIKVKRYYGVDATFDGFDPYESKVFSISYPTEQYGGEFVEFDITTNPTEAPADALLLQINVEERSQWKTGAILGFTYFYMERDWLAKQWNYGDENPIATARMWINPRCMLPPTKETTCTRCNGSGQVAGALGVGLMWTCGDCEGSGKV